MVVQTKHLLGALSLLMLALAFGCGDRLTGPEVVQIVDALEKPFWTDSSEARARLRFHGMTAIWAERLSRFHNVSSVTLRRNDQTLKYRAVVFERVVVGPGLDEHRDCASTYWSAFLWSEGTPPEGLLLVGGQFRERLRPRLLICSVFYLNRPEPMLAVLANEDQPRMNNPFAEDGDADISPGNVKGECAFLSPEDFRVLREQWGIASCEITRHRVRFRAQLSRPEHLGAAVEWGGSQIELRPTDVMGIRYTIRCDGTGPRGWCPQKSDSAASK